MLNKRPGKGNWVVPLTSCFVAARENVPTQPIGDDFESGGRHRFFDLVVFAGSTSLSVLQKMVHPRQFGDRGV